MVGVTHKVMAAALAARLFRRTCMTHSQLVPHHNPPYSFGTAYAIAFTA